jgi:hypothetical protein
MNSTDLPASGGGDENGPKRCCRTLVGEKDFNQSGFGGMKGEMKSWFVFP